MLAVAIEDRPGGLHELLEILAEHQINVLDAYGFVSEPRQLGDLVHGGRRAGGSRPPGRRGGALRVLDDGELYRL